MSTESQLAGLQGQALAIQERIRAVEAEINRLIGQIQENPNQAGLLQLQANALADQRNALREELARVNAKIQELQNASTGDSAGDIAREDQKALGDGATNTSPAPGLTILSNGRIQPAPETTAGTNADKYTVNANYGLDGMLRPFLQTQGVPVGSGQVSNGPARDDAFISGGGIGGGLTPGGTAGVGAVGDDSGQPAGSSNNKTVAELNSINYGKVVPQPNVLDQYASYTYQASLYLMTEQQYQTMINTKRKDIAGAQLLVQSGGASAGVGRNDFFSLDYYIDTIELRSQILGKGTNAAHNVSDVKFTVIEPNGISFIKNLDAAVQQYLGGSAQKKKNFTSQLYLMVIRFYGYDDQGNLVRGGVSKPDVTSDPNAFVEKWYPLALGDVKFKIQSKAVEYQISATAIPYQIGASAARGTIPFNIELSGQTLKDLLAGPSLYSAGQAAVTAGGNSANGVQPMGWEQAGGAVTGGGAAVGNPRLNMGRRRPPVQPAVDQTDAETKRLLAANGAAAPPPPKADTANTVKKTVRAGLMAALNDYQADLVKQKIINVADHYEVEFTLESLASAKITNAGLNIGATSMSKPGTAADQKLGEKQSMDPNSRVQGATAGMQIVQFLDTVVRTSSYIKSQQTVIIEESSGKETTTGVNIQNTSWYKIGFEVTPIQWDDKRNDYAYNIKYIISPYKISQLNSPYFKQPIYTGPHKQYSYWFTGQNDGVLSYEESLNALYYQTLSGSAPEGTSNALELIKYQYQTASAQTSQNAGGKVNEPSANAADQLYSPTDLGECNMSIVGDPAWLQQGEAWAGIRKGDALAFSPFLADGTINYDAQQILFEIGYNQPADYNLQTGLIEPAYGKLNSVSQQDQQLRRQGPTQVNRVYIATEVRSHFGKGKFTQDIKGTLLVYDPPSNNQNTNQRKPDTTKASSNAAIVNTRAPVWKPTKIQQPVPSSIPANPGTLGAALNALDPAFEGASILAAAEAGTATRKAPQLVVKDK